MNWMRRMQWVQIAHEHVKVRLNLLVSEIKKDIHFGMIPALVKFKQEAPPAKTEAELFPRSWAERMERFPEGTAEELPSLALLKIIYDLGDEWTAAVYKIYCEVWHEQGRAKDESFILDVWYEGLEPFIKEEMPSLMCMALAYAMPTLSIQITVPNRATIRKYSIEQCKADVKLAGIARAVDQLRTAWPFGKILQERAACKIPPVTTFALQMEDGERALKQCREAIKESQAPPSTPTVTVYKTDTDADIYEKLSALGEATLATQGAPAVEQKVIRTNGAPRLISNAPAPPALNPPPPPMPITGSSHGPALNEIALSPRNVQSLEETELRAELARIRQEASLAIRAINTAESNLAGEYTVLIESLKRDERKQELKIRIYVFDREATAKAKEAEGYKVAQRYHDRLMEEAAAFRFHKLESEEELNAIVAEDGQWQERTHQARNAIANALPARAMETVTKAPPPNAVPAKEDPITDAIRVIAIKHGKLEEWSKPGIAINHRIICQELDAASVPVPEEWRSIGWTGNKKENDEKVKARIRRVFGRNKG